jgi:hypothetical protein
VDKLYEALLALIETYATFEVYLEKAPPGTNLPYITFSVEIVDTYFDRNVGILTVSVWYDGDHTIELEQEVELIRAGLNEAKVVNSDVGFSMNVATVFPVLNNEDDIRKREVSVVMNIYFA